MRESPVFEVRLHRFEVWRTAVAAVALAAIAASVAWAWATAAAHAEESAAVVAAIAVAVALSAATIAAAVSLARMPTGVLSCRDGEWSFAADAGACRSGRLAVAIDWGSFLLLRLEPERERSVWLPVQRRGLEHDWHALRCAVYSPPRHAAGPATATSVPPE